MGSIRPIVWAFGLSKCSIFRIPDFSNFGFLAFFLYDFWGRICHCAFSLQQKLLTALGWEQGLSSYPNVGRANHCESGPSKLEVGTRIPGPNQSWIIQFTRTVSCSLEWLNLRIVTVSDFSWFKLFDFLISWIFTFLKVLGFVTVLLSVERNCCPLQVESEGLTHLLRGREQAIVCQDWANGRWRRDVLAFISPGLSRPLPDKDRKSWTESGTGSVRPIVWVFGLSKCSIFRIPNFPNFIFLAFFLYDFWGEDLSQCFLPSTESIDRSWLGARALLISQWRENKPLRIRTEQTGGGDEDSRT